MTLTRYTSKKDYGIVSHWVSTTTFISKYPNLTQFYLNRPPHYDITVMRDRQGEILLVGYRHRDSKYNVFSVFRKGM